MRTRKRRRDTSIRACALLSFPPSVMVNGAGLGFGCQNHQEHQFIDLVYTWVSSGLSEFFFTTLKGRQVLLRFPLRRTPRPMETQPWIQDPIAHKMSELPPNPSMQLWTFYSTSVFLCRSAQPNTLLRDGHCSDGAGDGTSAPSAQLSTLSHCFRSCCGYELCPHHFWEGANSPPEVLRSP